MSRPMPFPRPRLSSPLACPTDERATAAQADDLPKRVPGATLRAATRRGAPGVHAPRDWRPYPTPRPGFLARLRSWLRLRR